MANTLAELYLVEQLEAKFEATKRATEWLNKRLTDLRAKMEASERAVEVYRNESGLVRGKDSTLITQQISELNTQLILARTKRAEADARLKQVESLLRSPGGADSAAEVLSSLLIQKLREQEAEIQRKAAELAQEYGDKHPRMINARAEIRDLQAKIEGEVKKIVQGLRNEVKVAAAREESLRSSLTELEQRGAALNEKGVELGTLQRDANANRALYEQFLARFKETSEQKEIHQADARIISRADTPIRPSFPRVLLFIAIAFVASCLVAIGLVTLIERLDHGFRSMEQIEQIAGVPALGLVPSLQGMANLRKEPQDYILEKPVSAFGEAVRALHAGLLLSNVDNPPKLVLITSAIPNEGKTSLSLSFARMVAKQGQKKVVLVDCDLRRPQAHRRLKLAEKPGLVEYLAGEATLDEVLQLDEPSNALIVSAGRTPNNPTDLLTSEHFKDFLRKLSEACDLVILDSSPVLAVSDSRILARLADKTIFVVRWAETRREVAVQGIKQIVEAGADLAGVVLSMVNVKKHARYGYGDSGYYYGPYRKYYSS